MTAPPSQEVLVESVLRELEENGVERSEIVRTLVSAIAAELVLVLQAAHAEMKALEDGAA